ncbi:MAG: hypothetical protein F6K30_26640 [Cyanothece sp. SIO2G6]|nr:hypothetical protein [Cyanothece sp. SIO2G6]
MSATDPAASILSAKNLPQPTYNEFQVPRAFSRNCGLWEGKARRINLDGQEIDDHAVRVKIEIDQGNYVQINTVRIDTPREVTASYFGHFVTGTLVFPLTDEVYTLGGEKATEFSGVAWALTDDLIVYRGSRRLQGTKTYYNEIITLVDENHRVRTTQLFKDNVYTLVTMIDEMRVIPI